MTLPGFLIIGAMKAGTTTLYRDLLANPSVFMPSEKEPHALIDDEVLTDAGRAAYEKLFARARDDQIAGEASTGYTKLPRFPGVPKRARSVCGDELRLIYLVREPVSRIISNLHHTITMGVYSIRKFDDAVHAYPELIDVTRYAMQAQAWIDEFGRDHLRIVRFEDYVADRRGVVGELSEFLGIPPREDLVDLDAVYNKSEGKPVAGRRWKAVAHSGLYRRFVRPFLSHGLRDRFRAKVLDKAPERPDPPQPETVEFVYDQLADDLVQLRAIMRLDDDVWDRDAVRSKYQRSYDAVT